MIFDYPSIMLSTLELNTISLLVIINKDKNEKKLL